MPSNTDSLHLFSVTSQRGLNVASCLAWLTWCPFKDCLKVGTAKSDGWLLGVIAAPSALMHISAMAATSFCLPTSKAGNGVPSSLMTLSTLRQQSALPSGLWWPVAMPKLVRLHDQKGILNWLSGYDAVAFQLPG